MNSGMTATVTTTLIIVAGAAVLVVWAFIRGRWRQWQIRHGVSELDRQDGGTGRVRLESNRQNLGDRATCSDCGTATVIPAGEGPVCVAQDVQGVQRMGVGSYCPGCRRAYCPANATWRQRKGPEFDKFGPLAKFFIPYCPHCGGENTGLPS